MNLQFFSSSIRAITISTLVCGVALLTGCGKEEIRDTSSLSKSIIGLWQMEDANDAYLHLTPTTVREVSRQETENVKGDGLKVLSDFWYAVVKSSESENWITIAVREKGERKTLHTKTFKFSTIERDACEIFYEGPYTIGRSYSIGRHTYKGLELPINTANISD